MYISDSVEQGSTEPVGNDQPESDVIPMLTYDKIPRSASAMKADKTIKRVRPWLETLQRPADITNEAYKTFMRYCTEFFVAHDKLWRKNAKGHHKLVVPTNR